MINPYNQSINNQHCLKFNTYLFTFSIRGDVRSIRASIGGLFSDHTVITFVNTSDSSNIRYMLLEQMIFLSSCYSRVKFNSSRKIFSISTSYQINAQKRGRIACKGKLKSAGNENEILLPIIPFSQRNLMKYEDCIINMYLALKIKNVPTCKIDFIFQLNQLSIQKT